MPVIDPDNYGEEVDERETLVCLLGRTNPGRGDYPRRHARGDARAARTAAVRLVGRGPER
jgi:hypothetical protein